MAIVLYFVCSALYTALRTLLCTVLCYLGAYSLAYATGNRFISWFSLVDSSERLD